MQLIDVKDVKWQKDDVKDVKTVAELTAPVKIDMKIEAEAEAKSGMFAKIKSTVKKIVDCCIE